jgi:hypothetical protein
MVSDIVYECGVNVVRRTYSGNVIIGYRTPSGGRAREETVEVEAADVADMARALLRHAEGEDIPLLGEASARELTPLESLMESLHRELDERFAEVGRLREAGVPHTDLRVAMSEAAAWAVEGTLARISAAMLAEPR